MLITGPDMKIAVVKLSGKAIADFISNPDSLKVIKKMKSAYDGLIIVHGAGNQISEWTSALGGKNNFIDGQRVTDEFSMNIVAAVQAGMINSRITGYLCSKELNAIGLTGIDNNIFVADYIDDQLGFVGIPKLNKNISWLKDLMLASIIPVFSSICRDKAGNLMNVNADVFTNILASSLNADTVFFVSDVNGVILDGEIKKEITEHDITRGINNCQITGGMIPKVQSSVSLIDAGVQKVWIGSDLSGLLGKSSGKSINGTWITKGNKKEIRKMPVFSGIAKAV
jgi:acetylglutamate kinase